MAEVGLHRRQRAGNLDAVNVGQAGIFDRVTHRGAGPVGLDHGNRSGVDTRGGQSRLIHRGLRGLRRGGDIHGVTVLIGGGPAHDGQNPVAIAQRVGQPLE